jgi:hypothetical protein
MMSAAAAHFNAGYSVIATLQTDNMVRLPRLAHDFR